MINNIKTAILVFSLKNKFNKIFKENIKKEDKKEKELYNNTNIKNKYIFFCFIFGLIIGYGGTILFSFTIDLIKYNQDRINQDYAADYLSLSILMIFSILFSVLSLLAFCSSISSLLLRKNSKKIIENKQKETDEIFNKHLSDYKILKSYKTTLNHIGFYNKNALHINDYFYKLLSKEELDILEKKPSLIKYTLNDINYFIINNFNSFSKEDIIEHSEFINKTIIDFMNHADYEDKDNRKILYKLPAYLAEIQSLKTTALEFKTDINFINEKDKSLLNF